MPVDQDAVVELEAMYASVNTYMTNNGWSQVGTDEYTFDGSNSLKLVYTRGNPVNHTDAHMRFRRKETHIDMLVTYSVGGDNASCDLRFQARVGPDDLASLQATMADIVSAYAIHRDRVLTLEA